MAHLWMEDLPGEWAIVTLDRPTLAIAPRRPLSAGAHQPGLRGTPAFVLTRTAVAHRAPWCLLASSRAAVRVNGMPLVAGIRLLADQDEIRADDETWFFSSEELARVEAFAGPGTTPCARCQQPIAPGESVVRCPECGLWHHESEGSRCFSYAVSCAGCSQPTAADAGYRWTPGEH